MSDMHPTNGGDGGQSTDSGNQQVQQGFQGIVARQGSADAAGILLYQENHQHRETIRKLQGDLEKLQKKIPGKDVVVLSADQATQWQAYQGFGTPDEIKTVRDEAARHKREKTVNDAAKAANFNTAVLLDILPQGTALSVKSTTDSDGQPVNVAYIKVGESDEKPLTDYAKQTWSHFLPALEQGESSAASKASGTTFISQTPAGKPPKAKQLTPEERRAEKLRRNRNYTSI